MKKTLLVTLFLSSTLSANVHAEGWFDSLKGLFGASEEKVAEVEQPSATGLITSLSENLNINKEQATGGLASLLNFAKDNANADTFSALKSEIPGLDSIMGSLPDTSSLAKTDVGGLLDKAAQYSDSLSAVNELKKQFEALGLDTDMISGFVQQATAYLDTEQGQKAKELLTQSFSKLSL